MTDDLRLRSHGPEIAGRCPACKGTALFVGEGGHVTCSRLECPAPFAADDALRQDGYMFIRSTKLESLRERAETADRRLAAVREYIDKDFRFWCSPFGVASQYASALLDFIDREDADRDG